LNKLLQTIRSMIRSLGPGVKQVLSFLSNNPIKSVGLKLFLMFFVSILLFVIVMGTVSYTISKNVIETKVADAQEQTIIQASEKLDILYNTFEELSMQLIADTEFVNMMSNYYFMEKNTYESLQVRQAIETKMNSLTSNKSLAGLALFEGTGNPIYGTYSAGNNKAYGDSDWFKKIVESDGKVVWLETKKQGYVSPAPNGAFALGRIIKSSTGDTSVLIFEIKTTVIENELKNVQLGDNSQVFIANADNKLVYSSDHEKIETDAPFVIPANTEESEAKKNFNVKDENGQERLVVYHSSVKNSWNLVGSVPVENLVKEAGIIGGLTIWMSVIAAIVAAVIGYIIVRMIANPLVELRNLMKEGERGNLSVRTRVKSKDEIGQLGESFNQMMEQITLLVQQTNHSAQEVLSTSSELSEASRKTATSAREIAVATEEIASGASSLAVEAERGNEITSNIGIQMKEVVEANAEMIEAAASVQKASEQGTEYMSELIGKTNVTEEMTRSLIEKVDKLKESTRSIRKILDMLNNITKQTNILSLNATIEAARAGAAGRGFMVVADEIRKLADQSRQSIDVVGQITETIQKEIDETVSVLSEAYPLFQEQIVSVKEADSIFRQVRDQMNGFSSKLNEATESIQVLDSSQSALNEAMSNVSAVAQQSSATSEEVASLSNEQTNISDGLVRLSEKLDNLSRVLKDSLSKFSV
jgi:methyl-accepting chemotaxis protein